MPRRFLKTDVSESTPFDNSTNGFTADNAQAAIEEAKATAEGFPRAGIRCLANATVNNTQWIGPSDLLPNTPALVCPVNIKINEITWANQNTDVQFTLQFRTGSKTGTIFYTLVVTATNPGYGFDSAVNQSLLAGDTVWVQYFDNGQNCSDFDLTFWISREA